MSRQILLFLLTLTVLIFFDCRWAFSNSVQLADRCGKAAEQFNASFSDLPARVRWSLKTPSMRGRRRLPYETRQKVESSLWLKRLMDDCNSIVSMSNDLIKLYGKTSEKVIGDDMREEAIEISTIIVDKTRELSQRYRMANMALWHNFLIKIGAREGGYCYQWAEELFKALPKRKFRFFERRWGVHNIGKVTENNAVIFTKRGDPVVKGIVYDPWRGKGRPFWRYVSKDTQKWSERFTEDQVVNGQY